MAALAVSLPATSRGGEFYEGKSIRFLVGFADGDGYDADTQRPTS